MNFIQGEKISLRPLLRKDIGEEYLSWLNNRRINQYSQRQYFPVTEKDLESFVDQQGHENIVFAITRNDDHIGNILLHHISWPRRIAQISILIGEEKYWNDGFGTESWRLVTEYAFNTLNFHRLEAGTANPAMVKILTKLGWIQEGEKREVHYLNGKYINEFWFGLLKSEWNP